MTKFPEYKSQGNIQAPGGPTVQPTLSQGGEVAQAMRQFEEKFTQIRDLRQTTEASAVGLEAINNVLDLWDQDGSNLDPQEYHQKLDSIPNNITKHISGSVVRDQFGLSFGKQVEAAKYKITQSARKREVDSLRGTIELQGQQIINNPPDDIDDPLNSQVLFNYRELFNQAVDVGLYTKDQASAQYQAFVEKLQGNKISWDIVNDGAIREDESQVLRELKAGKKGEYAYLPSAERLKKIKESQSRIQSNSRRYESNIKAVRSQQETSMYDKLYRGELTITDLDNLADIPYEDGGVDAKKLDTVRSTFLAGQTKTIKEIAERYESSEKYIQLVDDVISNKIDKSLADSLIMKAYKDGDASGEEAMMLRKLKDAIATDGMNKFVQNIDNKSDKTAQFLQQPDTMISAWKALTYWFYKHRLSANDRVKPLRKFLIDATQSGANPADLAQQVIKAEASKNYPQYNHWEDGKSYNSEIGPIKVIGKDEDGMPIVELINAAR